MLVPLVLLALGSTWLILSPRDPFHIHDLDSVVAVGHPYWPLVFVGLAIVGMLAAAILYRKGPLPGRLNQVVFDLSFKHFFLDDIYNVLLVKPFLALSRLFALADHYVIDGAVRLVAGMILRKGHRPSLSEGSEWIDHHLIDPVVNEVVQPKDKHSISRASAWMDQNLIDRLVNGIATMVMRGGKRVSKLQSGKLQLYILYTLLTMLVLLLAMIYIFTS